ncbi:MAG: ParA family protein [Pseudomonadota bacterium]
MYITAMCSQKGGSGKTTLTGHLGVQAERAGHGPVALIDCDPQGSLAAWWNCRKEKRPSFVRTTLETLGEDLETLRDNGFAQVFIDTPPAVSQPLSRVMARSDLIVIPTRPSPHDLRAVRGTLDLAEHVDKPIVFVLNGAPTTGRIAADAAIALSQHGTVAPTFVHHRTIMASSMIDGRTAMEVRPGLKASDEIAALWTYIFERQRRIENRRTFVEQHLVAPRSFGRRGADDDATADAYGSVEPAMEDDFTHQRAWA